MLDADYFFWLVVGALAPLPWVVFALVMHKTKGKVQPGAQRVAIVVVALTAAAGLLLTVGPLLLEFETLMKERERPAELLARFTPRGALIAAVAAAIATIAQGLAFALAPRR
jgi:hypothetical protein